MDYSATHMVTLQRMSKSGQLSEQCCLFYPKDLPAGQSDEPFARISEAMKQHQNVSIAPGIGAG